MLSSWPSRLLSWFGSRNAQPGLLIDLVQEQTQKLTFTTSQVVERTKCGEIKKGDPCGKKADPCGKKADPCGKKADPCGKKADPCGKKADPCGQKPDPCGKKADPCAKSVDPCAKKEDPCQRKRNPCIKARDPCGKGGGGGKDNLTALLVKKMDLQLVQTPIPKIGNGEVLLRMDCVGICGSDVHYWLDGSCGPFVLEKPMVMGHEASGIVEEVAPDVKTLKPGDRVAIEPGVPCRYCEFCRCGKYHLCPDMKFCATPPIHGNLVRYYKHAADYCFKIPDHVTMEEACLIEPLSVGIHACRRGNVRPGQSVVILGANTIGLVNYFIARAMGATNILMTDIVDSRLDLAEKLCVDHTLNVKGCTEQQIVNDIIEIMCGRPDLVIEACGSLPTVRTALMTPKAGGHCVIVGMGAPVMEVPLAASTAREVDIRGIFRYVNTWPIGLELIASGMVNVRPLVTHHFDLEDTVKAYETAKRGEGIKIMIHLQPRDTNNPIKFKPE